MSTTALNNKKSKPLKPPKPPTMSKNGPNKRKTSKTKKPSPPTPPLLPQSLCTSNTYKKRNLNQKSPVTPPPNNKTKIKKSVPPPPLNRNQSHSTFTVPSKPKQILTRQQSNSTVISNNKNITNKTKPPPKQTRSLTKQARARHNHRNKTKCKPPPLPTVKQPQPRPRRKPPQKSKHQKAKSVQIMYKIPISPVKPICKPIFQHPTIGEFYSARVRKKKLQQRQLPSKPKDVNVYFVLMGKIYQYTINICLQKCLREILPKLSSLLAGNTQILQIITNITTGRSDRSLSSISKKINGNSKNEPCPKTYDLVIRDPIFIYKNNTYHSSQTFIEIGYDTVTDRDNIEHKNGNIDMTWPYVVILSCTEQEKDHINIELQSPKSSNVNTELPSLHSKKNSNGSGHLRSKTQNDMPMSFHAISNVLHLQRDNNSRYNDLQKCVASLGLALTIGVNKQQLIDYVHTCIENNNNNNKYLHINNGNKKPKRRRKRSRSCNGLNDYKLGKTCTVSGSTQKKEKTRMIKKRHSLKLSTLNKSNNDMQFHNMISLDLSLTNPTKLEFNSPNKMESKFSRLFRKSLSKKRMECAHHSTESLSDKDNILGHSSASNSSEYSNHSSDNEVQNQKNKHIKYKSYSTQNWKKNEINTILNHKITQKPRKYRKKNEIKICSERKPPPPPPPLNASKVSNVTITRRRSKQKSNNNEIIVEGYLSTNIGNQWKNYYYTLNSDRLLCSYVNKNCDLSSPIEKLSLVRGKCSFNINSNGKTSNHSMSKQTISVTIQTHKKQIVKHFRGNVSTLEKWKRAFLF